MLRGETNGYRHHPQLERFQGHASPRAAICAYLGAVHGEASSRGYAFDRAKLGRVRDVASIAVTRGQVEFEWEHLLRKLRARSPDYYRRWRAVRTPRCHPLIRRRAGDIESWERP